LPKGFAVKVPVSREHMTSSERDILHAYIEQDREIPTGIRQLLPAIHANPATVDDIGRFRPLDRRVSLTVDMDSLGRLIEAGRAIPGFLEAGPREMLAFSERNSSGIKAAVVTTGGLAPGLNSVIHSIVERHNKAPYHNLLGPRGGVWGVFESFKGLAGETLNGRKLDPAETEQWQLKGGCELGAIRFKDFSIDELSTRIAHNLARWKVDILYIIGGDGSLTVAHQVAKKAESTIVVGIPKTMDNDLLWVSESFGFNTAVAQASTFIQDMHCDAEGTRRVHVVELFGARSGFVAAHSALASGHVDLVLIPELFEKLPGNRVELALRMYSDYLIETLARKEDMPHEVIVVAEGVGKLLEERGAYLGGEKIVASEFPEQFQAYFRRRLVETSATPIEMVITKPRYYIRSVPANAYDQVYCKHLGSLAVDNALAGLTDFMISQWLTEYVLVPLELVAGGQKRIPTAGIFWKQVESSTGQPSINRVSGDDAEPDADDKMAGQPG
jgi:6-phosphofructokinase 1